MKELMKRRRKLQVSSKKSSPLVKQNPEDSTVVQKSPKQGSDDMNSTKDGSHSPFGGMAFADTGSICGSIGRSPLASEPGTPPELKALKLVPVTTKSSSTAVEPVNPALIPVTVKELRVCLLFTLYLLTHSFSVVF